MVSPKRGLVGPRNSRAKYTLRSGEMWQACAGVWRQLAPSDWSQLLVLVMLDTAAALYCLGVSVLVMSVRAIKVPSSPGQVAF